MDVAGARLASQLLADSHARSAVEVVRHLLAVQAQDGRGARLAIRPRSTGTLAAGVDASLNGRELVVSWLNRGTLQLVTADDYWWLHPLTTPQISTGNVRRLRQEGVSREHAALGISVIAEAVASGPRTRAELRERLDSAGVPSRGQALAQLLVAATLAGHIVRGPMVAGEQAFVSVEAWLGRRPPPLARDEGLARLADRYLAGHSPAAAEDLAKWAGITLADAQRGFALTEPDASQGPARPLNPAPPARLLGPFDPLLLGWASRELFVGPHTSIITTNGIFRPVALVRGRVAGTWSISGGVVSMTPLEPIGDEDGAALDAEAADVRRFLGLAPGAGAM